MRAYRLVSVIEVAFALVFTAIAVVTLSGGPGNLEGFALAAPDYLNLVLFVVRLMIYHSMHQIMMVKKM